MTLVRKRSAGSPPSTVSQAASGREWGNFAQGSIQIVQEKDQVIVAFIQRQPTDEGLFLGSQPLGDQGSLAEAGRGAHQGELAAARRSLVQHVLEAGRATRSGRNGGMCVFVCSRMLLIDSFYKLFPILTSPIDTLSL
jgi:hypothetical protein